MKVNQIYSLVNSVARQMWGENAITVTDLTGIMSLGKTVISSSTDRDLFLNTLVDRIGKTIIRTLNLELEFPNLMVDDFEWGSIIQKINVQPVDAVQNKSFKISENGFTPNQFDVNPIGVSQTFFTDSSTWEFDYTIPDKLLDSAFLSESALASFINAITTAVSDSMTMALNNMAYMAIDNFVAEKLKGHSNIVNVLAMYNTQFSQSKTQDTCLTDPEFCRYASMVMNNYIKYMSKPSKLYNMGGMVRATSRDNLHVLISADFASATEVYLQSDTFNYSFVELPNYKEYVCLQGTGNTTPNWKDNTTINIIPSSSLEGANGVVQSGIIGIFFDRQAIAYGYTDMYTGTDRNNRNRYTNYTYSATKQWLLDLSENGVIFIADENDKGISLDKSTLTFANSSADAQALTVTTVPVGETVTWASSDADVATVSSGTVTPVGSGTCTITATSEIDGVTYTATCAVTVGSTTQAKHK